ncbi:MAG: hypothetical protein JXD23_16875 [Spirochaetales bacterium]|nr:hypothetical protein [Spirochaetales bacterium]
MRISTIVLCFITAVSFLFTVPPLFAEGQAEENVPADLSRSQRDLGVVLLENFAVTDGRISFTAASGGCTTKSDFRVNVKPVRGRPGSPHYLLTIERIKADDCKALLPEGVVIVFDLERDLGLKGAYTFSVANPMASAANGTR